MSVNTGGALSGAAAGASAGAAAGPYGMAAGAVIGGVLGATSGGGGAASNSPAGPSINESGFGGGIFQDGAFTVGEGNQTTAPQTATPLQTPSPSLAGDLGIGSGLFGSPSVSLSSGSMMPWLIIGGLALVAVIILRRRGV